jgi:hypothetical protein
MEETTTTQTPQAVPTPQVATPTPTPPATPNTNPTPQVSMGGGGIIETLKGLNWLEIGFGILGAAALYSAISYYRWKQKYGDSETKSIQNKLDDLTMKYHDLESASLAKKQDNNEVLF